MSWLTLPVFLASWLYYVALSAKSFTWVFVSQDSGDWLAASTWWMAPQPVGSPLYILLGHGLNLLPLHLPMTMTLFLSALPSAITVALVYSIVRLKTEKWQYGLISSLVLLGASVFLTQSTVLEEYALATMFVVLAYWLYLKGYKKWTLVALGLGTAVHILVLLVTVIWWAAERKRWLEWLKVAWAYVIPVVLFYSFIPVLMAIGVPLISGEFSFSNLYHYATDTASGVGYNITIADFPERLGVFLGLCLTSLGLAWIPLILGLGRLEAWKWVAVGTCLLSLSYYLFSLDPSTWAFLMFGLPFLAILAGLGLARLQRWQVQAVVAVAIALVIVNGVFLNANVLTASSDPAVSVERQFKALPYGSAVIVNPGHYSLALFYVMAQGREDLTPILWIENLDKWPTDKYFKPWYRDYVSYYSNRLESLQPIHRIAEAHEKGMPLYVADAPWSYTLGKNPPWNELVHYYLRLSGDGRIREVTEVVTDGSSAIPLTY